MPPKITAIIVDDEPPARKLLRSLLSAHPQVEVAGEAADVMTAAELCQSTKPDLVFLDIQLPRMDGFSLLPMLKEIPLIIFVTAFDRHAVRAFEVNALDYLLKPIAPERLATSLSRLADLSAPSGDSLLDTDMVALREDSHLRMVPVRQITHIEAEDNYTRVHVLNGPAALIRRALGEWEDVLPKENFLRIARSLIVRLDAVNEFRSETRDLSLLFLSACDRPLELGRSASMRLRKAMEKL